MVSLVAPSGLRNTCPGSHTLLWRTSISTVQLEDQHSTPLLLLYLKRCSSKRPTKSSLQTRPPKVRQLAMSGARGYLPLAVDQITPLSVSIDFPLLLITPLTTLTEDFAGVPSVNIGFKASGGGPVYHYHSNYDSFYWMEKYGDSGWHYHAALAKVWGLLTAQVVESPIITFNATTYAIALGRYVAAQKEYAKQSSIGDKINFDKLDGAVDALQTASVAIDQQASALQKDIEDAQNITWYQRYKKSTLFHDVRKVNQKYKYLERQFLYSEGLDERNWFKHTVFAPGRWTGYAGVTFPGLAESLEDADVENFFKWEGIIAGQIYKAAGSLR